MSWQPEIGLLSRDKSDQTSKSNIMKRKYYFLSVVLLFLLSECQNNTEIKPDDYLQDSAVQWNDFILKTAVSDDGLLTLKGLRTTTIVHLAMHDVLNNVYPLYHTYLVDSVVTEIDPLIASNYAAITILKNEYAEKSEAIQSLYDTLTHQHKAINDIESKQYGEAVALAFLEKRKDDRWNTEAEYTWHPMAPGVYAEFNEHSATPEGFIFGAGWAKAEPIFIPSYDFFRAPPPPDIDSPEYAEAFNEVKKMGKTKSDSRTKDQTHLAMWWKDFVENSHNRLVRQIVKKENQNLWETTRIFALMNGAIYDAYINVFDNKFYYNHWRPYTAIRWASNDGNPQTEEDSTWNNLHRHTYAFPSYPSAHGTASAAAMTILSHTLGFGDQYSFSMTTDSVDIAGPFSGKMAMNPAVRSFSSFSEAAMEASLSRLYLGIHFRYDSEEGFNLGTDIAEHIVSKFLKPKTQ